MTRGIADILLCYILHYPKTQCVGLRASYAENDINQMINMTFEFQGFFQVSNKDKWFILRHMLEKVCPFLSHIVVDTRETMIDFCQTARIPNCGN